MDINTYKILNSSLEASASFVEENSNRIYHDLDRNLRNAITAERTAKWKVVFENVRERTDKVVRYLYRLKKDLLIDAAIEADKISDSLGYTKLSQPSKLFFYRRFLLLQELDEYTRHVFDTSSIESPIQKKSFAKLKGEPELKIWDTSKLSLESTGDISLIAAIAFLNNCEAKVRLTEHAIIKFIYGNTANYFDEGNYTSISYILSLSSTVVGPGDSIELVSGVGEFTTKSKPEYTIGGKIIKPDAAYVVSYIIHAPDKIGTYYLPFKVRYWNPDGTRDSVVKKIRYEVVDNCVGRQ